MDSNKEEIREETERRDEMKGGQKVFSSFIQLVKALTVPKSTLSLSDTHTSTHTPSLHVGLIDLTVNSEL